jgi:probable F420-dependent oxidoreductase
MVTVSLQAWPTGDAAAWLDTARQAEHLGFDALTAPDHPGAVAAPFVALAAAAAVTTHLELGSYVTNAGVREPAHVAADVATLDVVSGGRARLGLGAGHTPAEWHAVGRARPDVAGRVARCIVVVGAVQKLLAGEEVSADGPVRLTGARLEAPRPVRQPVPLTIGTSNSALLRYAGAHADVVGLSGLGRTLPDGHQHDVRWSPAEVDAQVALVASGATGRDVPPTLEALVQQVTVTNDAGSVAAELAEEIGARPDDLLAVPYVLIGTEEEIVDAVREHRRRWGISRYVVRRDAMAAVGRLLPRLAALT